MEQVTPALAEHQAPEVNTTAPSEYSPSTEEKQDIKLVYSLFEKAKKHRSKYDEKWLDYYKFFRGKQWKEQRPSYRHSEVINFVFQAIQSTVPIMTDSRPKFDYLPQEPQDMEFAEILSDLAAADWERGNWLMRLTEMIYDAHFYGIGYGHMGYEPKARFGTGAISFTSADPFYCFPDPSAKDINDDERTCKYFQYAEPVDIEELKKDYPDKKAFIKSDLVDLMQGDKTDLDQVKFKSPVDNKTIVEGSSANEGTGKNKAIKITTYIYSDEIDEQEIVKQTADGGEVKEYEQRLKYPNGRKIVVSCGIRLENGPIPYDDGLIPYAKLINYLLPREFYGISEVEQLEGPQKIFNKLVSFALDVLTLMGNPIWKVGTGANVDTDNLFNRPGLIVEAEDISQVQREEGVQLQPYVLQLIDRMQGWFDGISGANDVTRGVRPEGVTAASAISELQDAAQTRIRLKSRFVDACLQNLGHLYVNRVFQFYTVPQIVRVTGKDGAQKYFKFYVENQQNEDGTVTRKAYVRNFVQGDDGSYAEDVEAKEYLIRGEFDARVTTGSALPFAKTQRANLGFKLFELGVIDGPELLESVDYPNWEAVWARLEKRKAEAAQAQAMAQGGAPAQPPMPPQ